MPKYTFNNKENEFFKDLKLEVDKHFAKKKKTGNWKLYSKSLILIPLAIFLYVMIVSGSMSNWGIASLSILFGLTLASIGFNVMHDACHGSYSENKKLNYAMGMSLNFLGSSSFMWKQKHNIIHHTYTNVDGIDDDIAKSPVLRHCYTQKWVPAHRYQHLYLLPIYCLTSIAWVFGMDFKKYFSGHIHNTEISGMDRKEHIIFWLTKAFYVGVYIVLPLFLLPLSQFLLFYLTFNVALGVILSVTFQLAHVVEGPEFEHVNIDEAIKSESSWAEHQVRTTANFATTNKIVNWYVGGLNFQIEHHLFPRISHVHYPEISPIVQQICEKHNIPYHNFPKMTDAIKSHWKVMKDFGQNEHPLEEKTKVQLNAA